MHRSNAFDRVSATAVLAPVLVGVAGAAGCKKKGEKRRVVLKLEKMTCEGEYTTTATNLENTDEICSFIVPFMLEFWNVGALGGLDYEGVTFYWSYVDFNWGDCTITKMTDTTSTGQFSGGPGGSINVTWASIQLKYGQTAILSYNDEDESVEGTCTIDKPAAFSGWTGP